MQCQVIFWVCWAVLMLSLGCFHLYSQIQLPWGKELLLNKIHREYQWTEKRVILLRWKLHARLPFLKSINSLSDINYLEGIEKSDLGEHLDLIFKKGAWSDSDQDIMRQLEFENNVRGLNDIECYSDREPTCQLSKIQARAVHYKDKEKTERMDIYYIYTKVEFKLGDLNKGGDGFSDTIWNVFSGWFFPVRGMPEKISEMINEQGQSFLEYTSAVQDLAFYEKNYQKLQFFLEN